jgi:Fic family protein
MEKISRSEWPEIVFGTSDSKDSQAIRRAIKTGKLRKLAPRLYTSNFKDSEAAIVARNCYLILGALVPDAVLSHRTAFEGGVSKEGIIVLTYKYTKKFSLPGLTIRLIKGVGPQIGDTPFINTLFISSRPRAFLENLQKSRARVDIPKTVSRHFIEEQLEKICNLHGIEELNKLRDQARALAVPLNMQSEYKVLGKLIGALLGSRTADVLSTKIAKARAKGQPFDKNRIELFGKLMAGIKKQILPLITYIPSTSEELKNLAFFEAYFSNYIEGTEFAIEEAADIIFHNKIMLSRPQDAHDITATFQIVSNTAEMSKTPTSPEQLLQILKSRHLHLMSARQDTEPGIFKTKANRVGNTVFVTPELVQGTLLNSFSLYENLEPGIERALFIMFIVSEIHPFTDGNGRIARIMMNAELVQAEQSRIIIPTVYREDYLSALRRLSRDDDPDAYIRMLIRAQALTASIDFSDYNKALQQLINCNAFKEPSEGKLMFNSSHTNL